MASNTSSSYAASGGGHYSSAANASSRATYWEWFEGWHRIEVLGVSYDIDEFIAFGTAGGDAAWRVLEEAHDYIQWLFPNYTRSRFNHETPTLKESEMMALRGSVTCVSRFLDGYDMMLQFFGLRMIDSELGTLTLIRPRKVALERVADFVGRPHNFSRMTRILNALTHFGFPSYSASLSGMLGSIAYSKLGSPLMTHSYVEFWQTPRDADAPRDTKRESITRAQQF